MGLSVSFNIRFDPVTSNSRKSMSELLSTPLTRWHETAGARMAPFAGYNMPIQYTGILDEHHHTRTRASAFDTCHMGEFELRGPDVAADLERLLTQRIATLKTGRCRYGFLCNEAGGVIDDLTSYKRADNHYFLVVNAGTRAADAAHIQKHLSPGTEFTDLSPNRAKIDIQGPDARKLVEAALNQELPTLPYFGFADAELAGIPMTVSRTGYTGEWGYEFYLPDDAAEGFWQTLLDPGDIRPAGLGARDTLRLEMGYALYGHELNEGLTPVAATGGAFIDLDKDFIGKDAMDKQPARRLAGLQLASKRAARAHDPVVCDGTVVGEVTSGSVAPSLGVAVAMAYVDDDALKGDAELAIEVRGKALPCSVVELPFYKDGTARRKKKSN